MATDIAKMAAFQTIPPLKKLAKTRGKGKTYQISIRLDIENN